MNKQQIIEASLSRIWRDFQENEFGIITSWRVGDVDNKANLSKLKGAISSAGGEALMDTKAFEKFMVRLAHKYKQWGIVLHNPDKGTRLIQTSDDGKPVNKVDMKMSKFNPMKVAQFYSSLKGKPFTFEGFKYADRPQNHIHGMSLEKKGEVDMHKRESTEKWMREIHNILN